MKRLLLTALSFAFCISIQSSEKDSQEQQNRINQQNKLGQTALMDAVQSINSNLVQSLLELKADPTLEDRAGYNALGYSLAGYGNGFAHALVLSRHPKIHAIVNRPMTILGKKQRCLNAVINLQHRSFFNFDNFRSEIVDELLKGGAEITPQDVADVINKPDLHASFHYGFLKQYFPEPLCALIKTYAQEGS